MSQNQNLVTRETGPMAITPQERAVAHEALDRLVDSGIGGSTHDPNVAAAFIEYAMRKHICLSPVMGAFRMRPGWELAFTKLKVDTSKQARLVYKVQDDYSDDSKEWGESTLLAFHKPLLNIIRTHLGIDMKNIERIDDRSKDYRYEFKVFAEYLSIDGQIKTLVDQGGLDLSDDSAAVRKIFNEARGNTPEERQRRAEKTLAQKRAKVLQFATTNAEERLIISYGFRSSYTKGELDSKFIVCVRPLFTGYHPDPEMQKYLLDHMLQQQAKASSLLYGMGAGPTFTAGLPPAALPPAFNSGGPFEEQQSDPEVEPEPTQPQTQQAQCSPDVCHGKGAAHVKACFEPTPPPAAAAQATTPPAESWVITDGEMTGVPISDTRVTLAHLSSLMDLYTSKLESSDDLSEADVDRLKTRRRHVEAELTRRGAL